LSTPSDTLFEHYVATAPCAQNAVDALPGWRTAFPPEVGVVAGDLALGADGRITWALDELGGIDGARVLELGPLDGGHTTMLHAAGAARIDSVEANRLAFLRCLVTKELLGLDRAHFHHGDFSVGLGVLDGRYDLIVASGVLYHMADPVALLTRLAAVTDRLYLWTHVHDATAMPASDPRNHAFTGTVETVRAAGATVTLHERRYHGAQKDLAFCGGPRDRHRWIGRAGLLPLLAGLGLSDQRIAHDDPQAPGGPALSILAQRPAGSGA
jgi:hypothetical protein